MTENIQFIDAESEQLPQELTVQFLILEQVRRILRLGSEDQDTGPTMTQINKDGSQTEINRGNPRDRYINAVKQLRLLVGDKDEIKEKLQEIDNELQEYGESDEAQTQQEAFSWFSYSKHRQIFGIYCDYLNTVQWFGKGGAE